MSDHEARKKQLSDMQERSKTQHRSMPQELFFDVFCNPDKYPVGESSNTVGRHLECIDQVMGNFWTINLTRTQPNAKLPTKAHESDAGWDLYSTHPAIINSGHRGTINTGVSLEIPPSFVGLIWPRSGLSVKNGIDVLAGVIDSGYRGEIKVCLLNTSTDNIQIETGDRIAQILFQEVPKFILQKSETLQSTSRGDGGFGSSGK